MSRLKAISDLQSEIRELENTILHCQNRILRKRLAIEELFQGADFPAPASVASPQVQPSSAPAIAVAAVKGPSVYKMILAELPGINGKAFHYVELRRACIAKYPEDKPRIQRGVIMACVRLLKEGLITRVPLGFQVKKKDFVSSAGAERQGVDQACTSSSTPSGISKGQA